MALTLADIMSAPEDTDALHRHLQGLGLIAPPPAAVPIVPSATVGPLSPVIPHSDVTPMTPPVVSERGTMTPLLGRSKEIALGATSQPVKPMAKPENVGATPDIGTMGGTFAPSSGVLPTLAPHAPTAKESIATGMEQHGTTPKEEGRRQFEELRPQITASPGSSDFYRQQIAQAEFDKAHPWGGDISAHPGMLGKIGHTIGEIGQVAGTILNPNIVAEIPGTRLNRAAKEAGATEELGKAETQERAEKTAASEAAYRAAETEHAKAETEQAKKTTELAGQPTTDEAKTLHDLMTGGENGQPRINPETKQPYTYLEAYGATKRAGEKLPEQEKPLGDRVTQLNAGLTSRYRVLNPGKPLPAEFTLPANATQKDYDRIDKQMESTERATATKAQQDAIAEQRRLLNDQKEEAAKEKTEKAEMTLVRWRDPNTGRSVVMPLSKAKKEGHPAEEMEEIPASEKGGIQDARAAVHLINKQGKQPEDQGILQLIDGLDKDKKLGIVTTRLNSWLAGGVGTLPGDDPRILTLLDKAELAMTLTMKAHFGASGGRSPQMLEHFLNLANAKKMDAGALRAGFKAVGNYMADKAELPEATGGTVSTGGGFAEWAKKNKGQ
jgi:hypothetical protein